MNKERFEYFKARKQAILDKLDKFDTFLDQARSRSDQALFGDLGDDLIDVLRNAQDALLRKDYEFYFSEMEKFVSKGQMSQYHHLKKQYESGYLTSDFMPQVMILDKELRKNIINKKNNFNANESKPPQR